MKIFTEDEVLVILEKAKVEIENSAYTHTVGRSDGWECWDVEEIAFYSVDLKKLLV